MLFDLDFVHEYVCLGAHPGNSVFLSIGNPAQNGKEGIFNSMVSGASCKIKACKVHFFIESIMKHPAVAGKAFELFITVMNGLLQVFFLLVERLELLGDLHFKRIFAVDRVDFVVHVEYFPLIEVE